MIKFGVMQDSTYISYLTNKTVVFFADGAVEDVDSVLVHTPSQTVGGGAVVAALTTRLRHRKPSLQPPLVLLCRHQLTRKLLIIQARSSVLSNSLHTKRSSYRCRILALSRQLKQTTARVAVQQNKSCLCVTHSSDLSLLQQAGAGVGLISVGTRHLRLFTQHDDWT